MLFGNQNKELESQYNGLVSGRYITANMVKVSRLLGWLIEKSVTFQTWSPGQGSRAFLSIKFKHFMEFKDPTQHSLGQGSRLNNVSTLRMFKQGVYTFSKVKFKHFSSIFEVNSKLFQHLTAVANEIIHTLYTVYSLFDFFDVIVLEVS